MKFPILPTVFSKDLYCSEVNTKAKAWERVNPLPDMSILGSSNSAANKDMMSKILTYGDTIFVENKVGKEEIARSEQFLLFPQHFQKLSVVNEFK